MKNFRINILGVVALGLLSLTSCKDDKKVEGEDTIVVTEDVVTPAEMGTIEVTLNSDDAMKFDTSEIKVKEGQTVILTLNHTGKLPEAAMGHNFVLLKQGVVMADFATAAIAAKDNEYIPNDGKDVIAHTETIGGGESTKITFTAPAKGTYDFLCTFPGHYSMMNGKFIVE
ncbi:azurin [Flavobacterium ardleyense]|uniref:azurin n=1 Tax=Flavobacterium ardleyense TaxID=2038737 RepID=UPI00298CE0FA|nr:azurin [Flavobacterium ardleyense]